LGRLEWAQQRIQLRIVTDGSREGTFLQHTAELLEEIRRKVLVKAQRKLAGSV
jgi:hypothetical protein